MIRLSSLDIDNRMHVLIMEVISLLNLNRIYPARLLPPPVPPGGMHVPARVRAPGAEGCRDMI